MPLQPHNITTAKYYGFEGGGGARTRGESEGNTSGSPAITSLLRHYASAPRPLHPNDRDNDIPIREYLELINTTSNLAGHSVQLAYASKLGLARPQASTPPPPRPAGPSISSTQAHVGGPRRQVMAPADFTLTPFLRPLLHRYPSFTPQPAPATTEEASSWPGRAWRGGEEGGQENKLSEDFNKKFCLVVEDLLLSLARGGTANSTWPPPSSRLHVNLQTAAGQLQASFSREMKQELDNKTSGTNTAAAPRPLLTPATTPTASTAAARLLLLHMDGSPAKGALLPTLPYKGKINGSNCFFLFS